MLKDNDQYRNELANIMDGIAESVLEMTDEEIEAEVYQDEIDDPEEIRQILLNSVTFCRQKTLREARQEYEHKARSFNDIKYDIPDSPDEKRHLINAMIGNMLSQNPVAVTMQFREFENLPDDDLDGILHQLFALQTSKDDK